MFKIIMLGHSGVGKTTYMSSLYGIMQEKTNGFSLKAPEKKVHKSLIDAFHNIQKNKYPLPTSFRDSYDFELMLNNEPVFPFRWIDYRGKVIRESKTKSIEAVQLIDDLKNADGIMIFCDCTAILEKKEKLSEIGRIVRLVSTAVSNTNKSIPIAIIYTKFDLIQHIIDDVKDQLIAPIDGLIGIIGSSEQLVGSLTPVSCGSQFIDVQYPLLFLLFYGILIKANEANDNLEFFNSKVNEYYAKNNSLWGFLTNIAQGISGDTTNYQRENQARLNAEDAYNRLQILIKPSQELEEYIKNMLTF